MQLSRAAGGAVPAARSRADQRGLVRFEPPRQAKAAVPPNSSTPALQQGACRAQGVGVLGRDQRPGERKSRSRPSYLSTVGGAVLRSPRGCGGGSPCGCTFPTDYSTPPRRSTFTDLLEQLASLRSVAAMGDVAQG